MTIACLLGGGAAKAQDAPVPLAADQKQEIIDSVTAAYTDWNEISFSGKLSSPMLPVTASVKIYMVRDSVTLVSVTAPIIGEAARIEIDSDKAILVNKLNSSYASVTMAEIEPVCPGGLSAIQNLLLARVNILGKGQLEPAEAGEVELYDTGEGSWMLLPEQDIEKAPYVYFYTLGAATLRLERLAVLAQDGSGEADCFYSYGDKDTSLRMQAVFGGRTVEATLKLNAPDKTPKSMNRIQLGTKYRQTDLKGVLKN